MKKISDYLIAQYYDSPNIKAILDDAEAVVHENMDVAVEDLKPMMTNKAIGHWLELLGKRFNFPRPMMDNPDDAVFFGLVENGVSMYKKGTFNTAPFISDDWDYLSGKVEASDEMFLAFLSMMIGSTRTDGSQLSIARIIHSVWDGSSVTDHQNMTFTINVHIQYSYKSYGVITHNIFGGIVLPEQSDLYENRPWYSNDDNTKYVYFGSSNWIAHDEGTGETWFQITDKGYQVPSGGWGTGSLGSSAPTMESLYNASGNDMEVLLSNKDLIQKPAGVSFDIVPFQYFGFDNNESVFDISIFK